MVTLNRGREDFSPCSPITYIKKEIINCNELIDRNIERTLRGIWKDI